MTQDLNFAFELLDTLLPTPADDTYSTPIRPHQLARLEEINLVIQQKPMLVCLFMINIAENSDTTSFMHSITEVFQTRCP